MPPTRSSTAISLKVENRIVAERGVRDLVDQQRSQRKRDRERHEEPDLHGDLAVREAGREHQAAADATEQQKRADREFRGEDLGTSERARETCRHGASGREAHAPAPPAGAGRGGGARGRET